MRRFLALLFAFAAPLALVHPTDYSGRSTEGGWVAFRLAGAGSMPVDLDIYGGEPFAYGHAWWDEEGLRFLNTGIYTKAALDAGIQTPLGPREGATTGGGAQGVRNGMYGNGTVTHVYWVAGNVREWTWSAWSHPDVTVLSFETGSSAFVLTARDFSGGAGANAGGTFAGARANALGTASIEVERGLVGEASSWGVDRLVHEGPDGTHECEITSVNAGVTAASARTGCEAEVEGAGTHRFSHSGAGYGILNLDEFDLTSIDYAPAR